MRKALISTTTILTSLSSIMPSAMPGYAAGDVAKDEEMFKKFSACHVIANGDDVIYNIGKTGPNLCDVIGHTAGTAEGFKYNKSIVAAGGAGLVWDEPNLVEYVLDPAGFLKAYLDDPKAKSGMTPSLKKGAEAGDDTSAETEVVEEVVTQDTTGSSSEDFENAVSETAAPQPSTEGMEDTATQDIAAQGDGSLSTGEKALLLRQPGSTVHIQLFGDVSTRTVVERPDGRQIVTIRDKEYRALRRAHIAADGSETVLIDDTVSVEPVDDTQPPRQRAPDHRIAAPGRRKLI